MTTAVGETERKYGLRRGGTGGSPATARSPAGELVLGYIRYQFAAILRYDHHDSVVARTVLRDLAGQARTAREDTFTYGVMHERQACQAAEIERTLPQFAARAKKRRRHPGPAAQEST